MKELLIIYGEVNIQIDKLNNYYFATEPPNIICVLSWYTRAQRSL